jgi:Fanconi-associated nuclease 1
LDFRSEYFYQARKQAIDQRLELIALNKFGEIIMKHDLEHRPKKTVCVGLSWDRFEMEDFIQLAECITGPAMSRLFSRYVKTMWTQGGGVPDLV